MNWFCPRGWVHDTTTHSEGLASRNAGFIRQIEMSHGPLPDKSGVPVVEDAPPVGRSKEKHLPANPTPNNLQA
jgi:hypothetical protein